MPTTSASKTLHIPTQSEMDYINVYQNVFNQECAVAIKWIYRIQKWKPSIIEKRIPGVKASVWSAYGQRGYTSSRSLHICAALSWLTQITMSALYYGNNIEKFWSVVDIDVIECIVYSGLLPGSHFEYLVKQLLFKAHQKGYDNIENTHAKLEELSAYKDEDFLMPDVLDMDSFKADYYQSIAKALYNFRIENNLSEEIMAYVLNVPVGKYSSFEAPEKTTTIPLHLAMRLKVAFKIENTVPFTSNMTKYKQFNCARTIQQKRETVIIELMSNLDRGLRVKLTELALNVMQFHLF